MTGGSEADFTAAKPFLTALGNPTHVGPNGAGQVAKLANQQIVAITIGAVARPTWRADAQPKLETRRPTADAAQGFE